MMLKRSSSQQSRSGSECLTPRSLCIDIKSDTRRLPARWERVLGNHHFLWNETGKKHPPADPVEKCIVANDLTLEDVLSNKLPEPLSVKRFSLLCIKNHVEECLAFLLLVRMLKRTRPPVEDYRVICHRIATKYLGKGSENEINASTKIKRVIIANLTKIDTISQPDYKIFDVAEKEIMLMIRFGIFKRFKGMFTPEEDIPDIRECAIWSRKTGQLRKCRAFFKLPRFLPGVNQGLKNSLVFIMLLGGLAEIVYLGSSFILIAVAAGAILRITCGPTLDPLSYLVNFGLAPLAKKRFVTQSRFQHYVRLCARFFKFHDSRSYIEDRVQRWREAIVLAFVVGAIVTASPPLSEFVGVLVPVTLCALAAVLSLIRAMFLDWCPVIDLVECLKV